MAGWRVDDPAQDHWQRRDAFRREWADAVGQGLSAWGDWISHHRSEADCGNASVRPRPRRCHRCDPGAVSAAAATAAEFARSLPPPRGML